MKFIIKIFSIIFLLVFLGVANGSETTKKNLKVSPIYTDTLPLYGQQKADRAALILIESSRGYARSTSFVDLESFNVEFDKKHELINAHLYFPAVLKQHDLALITKRINALADKYGCSAKKAVGSIPTVSCRGNKTFMAHINSNLILIKKQGL